VPPTAPNGSSDTQNVINANYGPQLDNVQLNSTAPNEERTIFDPMASDAIFSLFSDPHVQFDNVQLDNTAPNEERTIFDPMASDTIFSLFSDHHVQLDSTAPKEERTILDPIASDTIFSVANSMVKHMLCIC
jgi:hypothetical protein